MTAQHLAIAALALALVALPHFVPPYFMHLLIQILLWGFVYTSWSIMGRFGFVSLGHGALWASALMCRRFFGITPG